MTMAFGLYNNKVKFSSALRVCIMSYIGNFIGTFILGGLLVLSGCASEVLTDYYSAIIPGKLELDLLHYLFEVYFVIILYALRYS